VTGSDVAVMAHATIDGDRITIKNVRQAVRGFFRQYELF
jgi:hypothetical protein